MHACLGMDGVFLRCSFGRSLGSDERGSCLSPSLRPWRRRVGDGELRAVIGDGVG